VRNLLVVEKSRAGECQKLRDRVVTLTAEKSRLAKNVRDLTRRLEQEASMAQYMARVKTDVSSLVQEIDTLKKTVEEKNAELAKNKENPELVTGLRSDVELYKKLLEGKTRKMESLNHDMAEVQRKYECERDARHKVKQQLKEACEGSRTLRERITALELEVNEKSAQITALRTRIEVLENAAKDARDAHSALLAKYKDARDAHSALLAKYKDARDGNKTLEKKYKDACDENKTLEKKYKDVCDGNKTLEKIHMSLHTKYKAKKIRVRELEEELATARAADALASMGTRNEEDKDLIIENLQKELAEKNALLSQARDTLSQKRTREEDEVCTDEALAKELESCINNKRRRRTCAPTASVMKDVAHAATKYFECIEALQENADPFVITQTKHTVASLKRKWTTRLQKNPEMYNDIDHSLIWSIPEF
jgi:chromosome segregation ATPase